MLPTITSTHHTETEVEVDLTADPIERWAAGAPGPCPICAAHVAEGSDCPDQHYNKARGLTDPAGQSVSLAKAVSLLKGRQ